MGKKFDNSENDSSSTQEQAPSVFVSGLPYSADQDAIKEHFSECGTIESIKLPRYQDTGKIIGYCHIIFSSASEAQKAIKLNKSVMGGRYLDISISKGEKKVEKKNDFKPPEDCKTIFVKNLDFESTEDEVGEFFSSCGKIENVRFIYHPHQKHFKGFAYIDFKMNSSVNAALKLNGTQFKGRSLLIDFEVGQMKQGFRLKKSEEGNTKFNQQYEDLVSDKVRREKKIHKFDKLQNQSRSSTDGGASDFKVKKRHNEDTHNNDRDEGEMADEGYSKPKYNDRRASNYEESGSASNRKSYTRSFNNDRRGGSFNDRRSGGRGGSFQKRDNLKLFS